MPKRKTEDFTKKYTSSLYHKMCAEYFFMQSRFRQAGVEKKIVKWQITTQCIQKIWNTLIQLYCALLVGSFSFHIPHWHSNYEQKATKKAYIICQCVFSSGVI